MRKYACTCARAGRPVGAPFMVKKIFCFEPRGRIASLSYAMTFFFIIDRQVYDYANKLGCLKYRFEFFSFRVDFCQSGTNNQTKIDLKNFFFKLLFIDRVHNKLQCVYYDRKDRCRPGRRRDASMESHFALRARHLKRTIRSAIFAESKVSVCECECVSSIPNFYVYTHTHTHTFRNVSMVFYFYFPIKRVFFKCR